MAGAPTEEQLSGFMTKLRTFRETLGEDDQKLLDAMYVAAMGKHEAPEEEVQSYWVAVRNPAGPVGGPGYGTTVAGPYGAAGFRATPWGTAYGGVVY
jgi:hypothetical protein